MSSLAIISYFKDEAHILDEWIMHHLSFGVQHIYLVDNGSSDSFRHILNRYKQEVTLLRGVNLSQLQAYQKAYWIAQHQYDWVALLDLDEFLYVNNYQNNIPNYLNTIGSDIQALVIYWAVFMPSKLFQPRSVIQDFTIACSDDHISERPFKSIFRTSVSVGNINYHCPKITRGMRKIIFKPHDELLQLNHYRFQSYEYLLGIKSKRGGGVHKNKYAVDATRKLIDQYLKSTCDHNDNLANLSSGLISSLNRIRQIKPPAENYNGDCWSRLVDSFDEGDLSLSTVELYNRVFSVLDKRKGSSIEFQILNLAGDLNQKHHTLIS